MINESNFFPECRRKLELNDWVPLMNEQSEKRLRLDLLMPLTGQSAVGMPGFIGDAFEEMAHEDSATTEVKIAGEIEGMTVEAFSTDSAEHPIEAETNGLNLPEGELGRRQILLTGSTLRNFKLVRITRDGNEVVALKFSVTSRADVGLVLWAYRYHGATFWGLFTQSEPELKPVEQPSPQMLIESAAVEFAESGEDKCPHPDCERKPHEQGEHAKRPADQAGPAPAASTDELFADAVKICREAGKASTSLLQRRLRVGYGRAAHLIDRMENEGLVGPATSAGEPRAFIGEPTTVVQ